MIHCARSALRTAKSKENRLSQRVVRLWYGFFLVLHGLPGKTLLIFMKKSSLSR